MAWDSAAWVTLNRQLTDEERARQLNVGQTASTTARDDFSVFELNDVYLETANAAFAQRGLLTYGCIFILAMGLMLVALTLWAATNPPANVVGAERLVALTCMGSFSLVGFGIVFVALWGIHQENFTWTRFPVRFNRKTRMVHAFRGAGSKGVISVPWDKAFFFIEPRSKDPISRALVFNLRCHVLDEHGRVTQSFSIGSRVTTIDNESTENGRSIVRRLNDQFEYIRRYMEGGPSAVPAPESVPKETSFANSRRIWTRDDEVLLAELSLLATTLVWVLRPFVYLTVVLHYIGMRTSREPVWPADIQAACANAAPQSLAGV